MDIVEFESSSLASETRDLANIWRALASGELTILSSGHSVDHYFLMLRRRAAPSERVRPRARSLEILRRSLIGDGQKVVAIEAHVAASTVAVMCSNSLSTMGAPGSTSRVPALLVLAAHAVSGARLPPALVYGAADPAVQDFVLRADRPDNALAGVLTRAEFAVTRCLVEGLTHRQIAHMRGTSKRTVANQLASTFKKLRITGRFELMSKLVRGPARNAAAA